MKAGIVTFTHGTNYGQRLQNLATQRLLESYGITALTIPQIDPFSRMSHRIKKVIRKILLARRSILEFERKKMFDKFNLLYIKFDDNRKYEDYDVFFAGSDQIWNPYSPYVGEMEFLQFVPKEKRIAFSPSFSVDSIPVEKREKYREYINGFLYLSVREDKGATIIKELTGRNATVLIDPTLMIDTDSWRNIERKPHHELPKQYIVTYLLGNADFSEEINNISRKLNLPVVDLKKACWYKTGPDEFLYIISHSSYVLTDSYHGTIFSILFRKQFRNFHRKSKGYNMGNRFDTLYSKLNIDRGSITMLNNIGEIVNYNQIYNKLELERIHAKRYLEKCINYYMHRN